MFYNYLVKCKMADILAFEIIWNYPRITNPQIQLSQVERPLPTTILSRTEKLWLKPRSTTSAASISSSTTPASWEIDRSLKRPTMIGILFKEFIWRELSRWPSISVVFIGCISLNNTNKILGRLQQFCFVLTITTLELFVLMLHSTLTAIVKKSLTLRAF